MKIKENYSLLQHNTFGINANCRRFVEYESPEELTQIIGTKPLLHIGGGSNLLFLNDFDGTILHSDIRSIEILPSDSNNDVLIRVGAAIIWDELVEYTLQHKWYGLENLSLIPGEVGASAVQNIGAYGAEAKDFIQQVECMNMTTGERRTFSNEECQYGYRRSIFKTDAFRGKWTVLYVTYRLSKVFKPKLDYGGIRIELENQGIDINNLNAEQLRQTIIQIRQAKLPDPKIQGNAGSFFMNPIIPRAKFEALINQYPSMPHYDVDESNVKIPAGWLIEQCGWKGRSLGRAAVHSRQALVLVNLGGATGQEILTLCEAVRNDVREQFDITINPEVNFIR